MTSLWDPGNLLQITDDLRSRAGEIKCLGKNRHDARCGWDVPQPKHSEVGPLLRVMSHVKPEAITTGTLRTLARLCLCVDFHAHQAEQVVSHWRRVLETAGQHHQTLLQMEIPVSDQVQTLQVDLASKQGEYYELKRELDREIASNAQQSNEWERKSDEMTTKITHLEQQLSRSEYRLKITEAAMADQEQAKQTLLEQNKEELAARIKAEEENTILQSRLNTNEDKLNRAHEENEKLVEKLAAVGESNKVEFQACQDEISQLKATVQGLTKERDDRDTKLKTSEDKLKASEDTLKMVREENKTLSKDLATVAGSNEVEIQLCQDEINRLKATVQNLTKERDDKDAKLKIVRGEKKNLIKELATVSDSKEVETQSCQDEINRLKATVQGLTRERDDRDVKLEEYHTQLGKQLAQNTLLDDRITSLEQTQAQLEASIVSCWMHSFWAWTTRFKGRRNKPQLVEGSMELKTYA